MERLPDANLGMPMAQHPLIDESLCMGCGSCAAACPEGDVLGIVYGKAKMLNPLRCVGHGECARACPVGAIQIGLGDIRRRNDLPLLNDDLQTNIENLYIAGELGGLSLIHNAVSQGKSVIEHIAASAEHTAEPNVFDVAIIGAGPAGLSAALAAVEHKLSYTVLEQFDIGGSILQFPSRKLIMVQPFELPLIGKLNESGFSREDLLDIWEKVAKAYQLRILTRQRVQKIRQKKDHFIISASGGEVLAKHVLLAIGRRGTPRKLNIPGEKQSKVTYQLQDVSAYRNRNILVVGGGDSAVEAAIALAKQAGNRVVISYRKGKFLRIKKKNLEAISGMIQQKKILPIFNSNLIEIKEKSVRIKTRRKAAEIPNDDVFIMIGGLPPFQMLKEIGIAFSGETEQAANLQVHQPHKSLETN